MPIQYINTGTAPNQGNGDSLRLAFTKINNNFSLLADNTFAYGAVGEVIDHPELQRGISVTYNPNNQAASFLVNIAGADTLGAVRIGGGITLNPDTGLISVFDGNYNNLSNIPQALGTTASPTFADLHVTGSLDIAGETTIINDTVIETANLTITLAKDATGDSSANTAGIIINGPETPASLRYAASDDSWNFNKRVNIPTLYVNGQFFSPGNLGDITVDLNVISTANQDQDIVLNPDGIGRVRFPSTPIQFDNGVGGTYRDHLIYTAPDSGKVGLGVGESNNSLRIVGDGVTPGIVADFGTYANGTGTWASTVTVDSNGSIRAKGTIYQGTAYDNIEYTDTSIRVDADVNSFAQMIMQNHNTGTTASTDLVIMNDLGNDFDHIIDLGINSSNYNTPLYSVTGPNDGYLFVNGGDLVIGTQSPGQKLVFHVDGTTSNDAGGYLDTNGWTFNRSTNVLVSAPLPVGFRVQNTSNNVEAKATLQVANNTSAHLQIGINSDNPSITFGNIGPGESFIHNHETTSTLHIGNIGNLVFYSNEATGFGGTPTLVMSRVDQSSTFAGHVLPAADLTYDLGSTSSQWRSLYVGTSTIYLGGTALSVNPSGSMTINGNAIGVGSSDALTNGTQTFTISEDGGVIFSGDTGGANRGLVWDYGAEVGGENSTVRQDAAGLSVRAWTEVLENEELYSAPVNIVTNQDGNAKVWTFDGSGNLTFPDSSIQITAFTGTVAYSNVTGAPTVPTKTTGSWTLDTGTNTVSITVPQNGNYTMWVNGNIPNGIVSWNATVNVSNSNVPAIGSQYAWYYDIGNMLVLTSIPDQIVGTVGSISTANTYVGNSSNVFTFGITNNSTSSQVVNWGYVTL